MLADTLVHIYFLNNYQLIYVYTHKYEYLHKLWKTEKIIHLAITLISIINVSLINLTMYGKKLKAHSHKTSRALRDSSYRNNETNKTKGMPQ